MAVHADRVVVDTSVVSIFLRGDSRAQYYRTRLEDKRLWICFQTLEEVWHGAAYAGWGDRRNQALQRHLERYEVAWPDETTVQTCAELRAQRKKKGREIKTADAWIAATAIALGCPLVSDNGDFVGIDSLELIRAPEPPGRPGAG